MLLVSGVSIRVTSGVINHVVDKTGSVPFITASANTLQSFWCQTQLWDCKPQQLPWQQVLQAMVLACLPAPTCCAPSGTPCRRALTLKDLLPSFSIGAVGHWERNCTGSSKHSATAWPATGRQQDTDTLSTLRHMVEESGKPEAQQYSAVEMGKPALIRKCVVCIHKGAAEPVVYFTI